MRYIVTISMPNGDLLECAFKWWEFECGYMDRRIAELIHDFYPDSRYTRDNAGVIHLVDGIQVVSIRGV